MRYKTIPNEKFEFITDRLSWSTIEFTILSHYDLGDADSSNFTELTEGMNSSLSIMSTKGIITFSASVGKMKDGKYLVTCYPSNVKKYN